MVFLLSDTNWLQSVRTSGMMDNVMIITEGRDRSLNKLEGAIGMKNLRRSGILSDNLRDKVGDHSANFRAVVEKVDQTHTSVIINKHNIITMT